MLTKETITGKGRELGFEDVGFMTADPFDEHKQLLQENPDERVRAMAAWALGKIGGEAAQAALLAARDSDSQVVNAEVAQALAGAYRVG